MSLKRLAPTKRKAMHKTIIILVLIMSSTALAAIALDYRGAIHFHLGPEGIELELQGQQGPSQR